MAACAVRRHKCHCARLCTSTLPILLVIAAISTGVGAQELAQYDSDVEGVRFFQLPDDTEGLFGGVVANGTRGYFGATTEVYVVDFAGDGDAAQLSSTIELPARVLAISGIEGPPPFTTPVDFNDTSTVAFCSDTGSFGGGVARINVGNFSDVAWVNESLWVYFQGCAGNPTTGNVYLIDGGSGSGQGMNIRFVVPGSTVLSLQLELPVHTFLPGGDSVTVDVVVDDAAQLLYVSGVYKPDVARVSAAEAPFGWQWGVTIVSLANFDVQATLPVAPAVVSSSSVNSLQKLIVGKDYLYVILVQCPSSTPVGLFCSSQGTNDVTILAYPLERVRSMGPTTDDDAAAADDDTSGSATGSIPAPAVATVSCPNAFPGIMAWLDEVNGFMYMRCGNPASGYQLLRVQLSDLSPVGSTCDSFLPDGFGVMYASPLVDGAGLMGVASGSGLNYVAYVNVRAMAFDDKCSKFYQQWWFIVAVIGGALVIAAVITACVALHRSVVARRRMAKVGSSYSSGGYAPNGAMSRGYAPPHFPGASPSLTGASPRFAGASPRIGPGRGGPPRRGSPSPRYGRIENGRYT